jgi:hypothetical protein
METKRQVKAAPTYTFLLGELVATYGFILTQKVDPFIRHQVEQRHRQLKRLTIMDVLDGDVTSDVMDQVPDLRQGFDLVFRLEDHHTRHAGFSSLFRAIP